MIRVHHGLTQRLLYILNHVAIHHSPVCPCSEIIWPSEAKHHLAWLIQEPLYQSNDAMHIFLQWSSRPNETKRYLAWLIWQPVYQPSDPACIIHGWSPQPSKADPINWSELSAHKKWSIVWHSFRQTTCFCSTPLSHVFAPPPLSRMFLLHPPSRLFIAAII